MNKLLIFWMVAMLAIVVFITCSICRADEIPTIGTASWYSRASCAREGTSGICADGKELKDYGEFSAASWFYRLGARVRVTHTASGRSIIVRIRDRGPARRLVRKGRIIDLNIQAFDFLASRKQGIISVKVEVIK